MVLFTKLVVATDLSERARHGAEFATQFGAAIGAEVTTLHVDELAEIGFQSTGELTRYLGDATALRDRALDLLEASLARIGGSSPRLAIVGGRPYAAIASYAQEQGCDLIVVAPRASHSLGQRLLGTTTERLLRATTVPVLVVPEASTAPAPRGPILTATSLTPTCLAAVGVANALAGKLRVRHIAAHVVDWPQLFDTVGTHGGRVAARVTRGVRDRAMTRLKAHLAPVGIAEKNLLVAGGPAPADALLRAADAVNASLIVVSSRIRSPLYRLLLGSTMRQLVRRSRRPVLWLPHAWLQARGVGGGSESGVAP